MPPTRASILAALAAVALACAIIVGYAVWPRQSVPVTLIGGLDATSTVAAVEVNHLSAWVAETVTLLDKLPAAVHTMVATPTAIAEKLGFDPRQEANWLTVGLDLRRGVAVSIDRRLSIAEGLGNLATAVVLLPVTDRDKLLAWAKRIGVELKSGATVDAVTEYQVGERTLWVGVRGEMTAVLAPPRLAPAQSTALHAAFASYLRAPNSPLADSNAFQLAARGVEGPGFFAYADTTLYAESVIPSGSRATDQHLVRLFPQLALWVGATSAVRVTTTERAHTALLSMFEPSRAAPECATLVPRDGWVAMRLSLNLVEFAHGLERISPRQDADTVTKQLTAAQEALASQAGVAWPDLAEALSGHFCVAVDGPSTQAALAATEKIVMPTWVAVVGVQDRTKADAVLAKLAGRAKSLGADQVAEVQVAGRKAWTIANGSWSATIASDGDRWVAGSTAGVVELALSRSKPESLASRPASAAIDGPVAWGLAGDLRPFVTAPVLAKVPAASRLAAQSILETATGDGYFAGLAATVDKDGVTLAVLSGEGSMRGLGAATGLVAIVSIRQLIAMSTKGGKASQRLIGTWTADLDRVAEMDEMKVLPADQRQAALELAKGQLGQMSYEFTADRLHIDMLGQKKEGTYTVTSEDGDSAVIAGTIDGQTATLYATFKGDGLLLGSGGRTFPLRRKQLGASAGPEPVQSQPSTNPSTTTTGKNLQTNSDEFYRTLFAPLQAKYGALDAETVTALVGFSAGGPVSLSKLEAKNLFVTCELAADAEQKPSSEGLKFELFSAEGRSLDWSRRVLTKLGALSFHEVLGDQHTIEVDTEVVKLRLFSRTRINGVDYGLYEVMAASPRP